MIELLLKIEKILLLLVYKVLSIGHTFPVDQEYNRRLFSLQTKSTILVRGESSIPKIETKCLVLVPILWIASQL